MNEAIGDLLPVAVGVAISPLPIVAVVLMLLTPRGRTNGFALVLGWVVGTASAGTLVLTLASGADASKDGEPAEWVAWLTLALGVLLILLSLRQWRARPHADDEPAMPKWMGAIEGLTAAKATAAGFALSALNPKNLLLIVAGAAAIAHAGIGAGEQAVAMLAFTLIASLGVAVPIVIYVALGDRSRELLDGLKAWMIRNNTAIMAVLLLVIGVKLLGDAIAGFGS